MQVKIKCPGCNAESTMFLVKESFKGPFRCWKCHGLYTIRLKSGEILSCEPLSQEEYDKQQKQKEAKAKKKSRREDTGK